MSKKDDRERFVQRRLLAQMAGEDEPLPSPEELPGVLRSVTSKREQAWAAMRELRKDLAFAALSGHAPLPLVSKMAFAILAELRVRELLEHSGPEGS